MHCRQVNVDVRTRQNSVQTRRQMRGQKVLAVVSWMRMNHALVRNQGDAEVTVSEGLLRSNTGPKMCGQIAVDRVLVANEYLPIPCSVFRERSEGRWCLKADWEMDDEQLRPAPFPPRPGTCHDSV